MVSQVRHGVVDGTTQQIMTVLEFGEAHPFEVALLRLILPLRKSWK